MRSSGSNFTSVLQLLHEIHHVVRKIQVLCYALGIVDVIERAAAVLRRSVALQLGQPALVPELHGQPYDGMPLLLEQRGNGRRVNAAAHALFILRENQSSLRSNCLADSSHSSHARSGTRPPAYDRVTISLR